MIPHADNDESDGNADKEYCHRKKADVSHKNIIKSGQTCKPDSVIGGYLSKLRPRADCTR